MGADKSGSQKGIEDKGQRIKPRRQSGTTATTRTMERSKLPGAPDSERTNRAALPFAGAWEPFRMLRFQRASAEPGGVPEPSAKSILDAGLA